MTDFDPNWPHGHVTRDGRKARIICTLVNNPNLPIIALVQDEGGVEYGAAFEADGRRPGGREFDRGMDLINAPPPKRKFKVNCWLNVDLSCNVSSFDYRDHADHHATHDRIACIRIEREVEEGEGLDD